MDSTLAAARRRRTPGATVPRSSPMTTAPARSASMASTASSSSVGWLDVGAVGRVRAVRHPPLAEQAQHVVDAQAAAVRHGRPDGVDERPVAGQPQPGRHEGRQSPALAGRVEDVGRCAQAGRAEHPLPHPGVEAAGVEADRQVVDQPQLATGRGQLPVEQPLHPDMEGDAVDQAPSLAPHGDAVRIAQVGRPGTPARPVLLAQRGKEAPSLEIGPRGGGQAVQRRAGRRRLLPAMPARVARAQPA